MALNGTIARLVVDKGFGLIEHAGADYCFHNSARPIPSPISYVRRPTLLCASLCYRCEDCISDSVTLIWISRTDLCRPSSAQTRFQHDA